MARVTEIHGVVLAGDFQKPALLFNGMCIVEAAGRNRKDDEVVVKASGGSISM